MPHAPLRPCLHPGCGALVQRGYCPAHKRRDTRPSAWRQGYDKDWTQLRNAYLMAHPICQLCGQAVAREVDHIVPIRRGGARLDARNLQSACLSCHRSKTARERTRYT